jgi:hypothetical protein
VCRRASGSWPVAAKPSSIAALAILFAKTRPDRNFSGENRSVVVALVDILSPSSRYVSGAYRVMVLI